MPIYEFKCRDCGRLTSIFVKTMSTPYEARCRHCGGQRLERAVSRFAYHKSEQTILEEYGMELPKEAREMIDAAREGEFPEPVKDL